MTWRFTKNQNITPQKKPFTSLNDYRWSIQFRLKIVPLFCISISFVSSKKVFINKALFIFNGFCLLIPLQYLPVSNSSLLIILKNDKANLLLHLWTIVHYHLSLQSPVPPLPLPLFAQPCLFLFCRVDWCKNFSMFPSILSWLVWYFLLFNSFIKGFFNHIT